MGLCCYLHVRALPGRSRRKAFGLPRLHLPVLVLGAPRGRLSQAAQGSICASPPAEVPRLVLWRRRSEPEHRRRLSLLQSILVLLFLESQDINTSSLVKGSADRHGVLHLLQSRLGAV